MGEASLWGLALGEHCPESSESIWGWVVYPLLMLYAFYILAQICDGHLTTALEFIVERVQMSEDVAGATFLAMASSAPELFTSIIATFVLESASGVGNVLGSAVFNLLVIIGVVPIFSGNTLKIWWYPTARDAVFYTIAILEVFLVMLDGAVYWWEGGIMTVSYFLYAMYFTQNERVIQMLGLTNPVNETPQEETEGEKAGGEKDASGRTGDTGGTKSEISAEEITEKSADAHGRSETRSASRNSFTLKGHSKTSSNANISKVFPEPAETVSQQKEAQVDTTQLAAVVCSGTSTVAINGSAEEVTKNSVASEEEEEGRSWCRCEPIMALIDATMPVRPERLYTLFALCCVWIGVFTYFAVDASTRLGCLLNLDDEVMGLVILAAGTSVPDAMGSVAVAKDGLGDMAVANAVGSNTFDILLGLGLPWFVWGLVKGEPILFNTVHLNFAIAILAGCLVGYLAMIVLNRWVLTKKLGCVLLFSYVCVMFLILMRYYGHF